MASFATIIDEALNGSPSERKVGKVVLGTGDGIPPERVTQLDTRLKELRRQLEVYFAVCVAMVALIFLAQLYLVIFHLDRPDLVKAAVATCGVTTSGLIVYMARLWRERERTGTVIILASQLDAKALRAVLHALLKNFGPAARSQGGNAKNP